MNRPAVLLLDEPLVARDLKLRKALPFELEQLQQQVGVTFVYVTHDQEEALTMADRIAVMSEGRVLQVGTPDEIYERPTGRFVADVIGESNVLGTDTRYRVAVEGGELIVPVQNQHVGYADRREAGDDVRVSWHAHHASLLR